MGKLRETKFLSTDEQKKKKQKKINKIINKPRIAEAGFFFSWCCSWMKDPVLASRVKVEENSFPVGGR